MSAPNITTTRDTVSENELEVTAIVKISQGTALSNFTCTKFTNDSALSISGQNLDLEENDKDREDPEKICHRMGRNREADSES